MNSRQISRGFPARSSPSFSGGSSEKEWESWDREIEADSQAGRLDFLLREAHEEKAKGTLKEM
jgi:hypothetical protein